MNTTKRFDNAIAALVKGYLKGTLAKGTPCGCAVGNIVAFGMGQPLKWEDDNVVCVTESVSNSAWFWDTHAERGLAQIATTGYSVEEILRIERAFEKATKIDHTVYERHTFEQLDEDQLNGLHAVVQVLCQIEGITDPTPYKAQFDRATEDKSLPLADIIVG